MARNSHKSSVLDYVLAFRCLRSVFRSFYWLWNFGHYQWIRDGTTATSVAPARSPNNIRYQINVNAKLISPAKNHLKWHYIPLRYCRRWLMSSTRLQRMNWLSASITVRLIHTIRRLTACRLSRWWELQPQPEMGSHHTRISMVLHNTSSLPHFIAMCWVIIKFQY